MIRIIFDWFIGLRLFLCYEFRQGALYRVLEGRTMLKGLIATIAAVRFDRRPYTASCRALLSPLKGLLFVFHYLLLVFIIDWLSYCFFLNVKDLALFDFKHGFYNKLPADGVISKCT